MDKKAEGEARSARRTSVLYAGMEVGTIVKSSKTNKRAMDLWWVAVSLAPVPTQEIIHLKR